MKGRKKFLSLLLAMVMTVICLPQVALAATQTVKLASEPENGSVMIIEEASQTVEKIVTTAGLDIEKGSIKIKFIPDEGYEVDTEKSKIKQGLTSTSLSGIGITDNTVKRNLTTAITITAVFKKYEAPKGTVYENPGSSVTLEVVDDKVIWNKGAPISAGKNAVFSFDAKKPTDTTGTAQDADYTVSAVLNENGTEKTVALAKFNQNFVRVGAALSDQWNSTNNINRALGADEGTFKVILDLENGTYKIEVYKKGGPQSVLTTANEAITEIADFENTSVVAMTIEAVGVPADSSWTVKNFALSEDSGATEPGAEYMIDANGEQVSYKPDEKPTGKIMVYEMELQQPTANTDGQTVWHGSPSFRVKMTFRNNSDWYIADMASFSRLGMFPGGTKNPGSEGWFESYTASETEFFRLQIEVNVPNKKFKLIVLNPDGTLLHETAMLDIEESQSGSLTDFSEAWIDEVVVYGNDVKGGSSLTFRNMKVFDRKYKITAAATNGEIRYNDEAITELTVEPGESRTLTFVPNEGYELKSVTVNGRTDANAVQTGSLSLENISSNREIVATFGKEGEVSPDLPPEGAITINSSDPSYAYLPSLVKYGAKYTLSGKWSRPSKRGADAPEIEMYITVRNGIDGEEQTKKLLAYNDWHIWSCRNDFDLASWERNFTDTNPNPDYGEMVEATVTIDAKLGNFKIKYANWESSAIALPIEIPSWLDATVTKIEFKLADGKAATQTLDFTLAVDGGTDEPGSPIENVVTETKWNEIDVEYTFKDALDVESVQEKAIVEIDGRKLDKTEYKVVADLSAPSKISFVLTNNGEYYDSEIRITIPTGVAHADGIGYVQVDEVREVELIAPVGLKSEPIITDTTAADGKYKISNLEVKNNSVADQNGYALLICVYDENGIPVQTRTVRKTDLALGSTDSSFGDFEFTNVPANAKVSCYIFDSFDNLGMFYKKDLKN